MSELVNLLRTLCPGVTSLHLAYLRGCRREHSAFVARCVWGFRWLRVVYYGF